MRKKPEEEEKRVSHGRKKKGRMKECRKRERERMMM
jgi:hypothetical protein